MSHPDVINIITEGVQKVARDASLKVAVSFDKQKEEVR